MQTNVTEHNKSMKSFYHHQVYIFTQGTWEMEGDMLKGKFTRKDNNKVLTTTRELVGGELVQVSRSTRGPSIFTGFQCSMLITAVCSH